MTKPMLFLLLSFVCTLIAMVFGAFLGYTMNQDPVNIMHETIFGIFTVMFICGGITFGVLSYMIKEKFL